jgi:hypothetical protein
MLSKLILGPSYDWTELRPQRNVLPACFFRAGIPARPMQLMRRDLQRCVCRHVQAKFCVLV